ncbi:protein kinase family protein [Aquipuribacter hungaricus]|uniref:Protein kinase domain-containing protein n=2 Tax=Aquipuribacter hungaricus TaxID=545624 RepID=A0ABV7WJJ3_9MICO
MVDRIGPGTLLAGRYRLEEQVQTDPVTTLWRAEDTTLERPVGVRLLPADHPRAQPTLDAARRVALVDDARLQRVFGVGVEVGAGYVVLEWVTGQDATALAGDVTEQEALRVVVEAAEALRTAASRQLHHGRLGPRQVVRAPDGRVRVLGTAVDVAAVGQATPAAAARPESRDVRDLTAVLYALLTGRWPFGATDGTAAAPTEKGRPVGVRALSGQVTETLETVVAEVLAGTGPETLDGLVQRLHAVREGRAGAPGEAGETPAPRSSVSRDRVAPPVGAAAPGTAAGASAAGALAAGAAGAGAAGAAGAAATAAGAAGGDGGPVVTPAGAHPGEGRTAAAPASSVPATTRDGSAQRDDDGDTDVLPTVGGSAGTSDAGSRARAGGRVAGGLAAGGLAGGAAGLTAAPAAGLRVPAEEVAGTTAATAAGAPGGAGYAAPPAPAAPDRPSGELSTGTAPSSPATSVLSAPDATAARAAGASAPGAAGAGGTSTGPGTAAGTVAGTASTTSGAGTAESTLTTTPAAEAPAAAPPTGTPTGPAPVGQPSAGDSPAPTDDGTRERTGSQPAHRVPSRPTPVAAAGSAAAAGAAAAAGGLAGAAGALAGTPGGGVPGTAGAPASGTSGAPTAGTAAAAPAPAQVAARAPGGPPAGYVSRAPVQEPDEDDGWDLLPVGDQSWDEDGWDAAGTWTEDQQPWDDQPWEDAQDRGRAGTAVAGAAADADVLPLPPKEARRRGVAGAGTGVAVVLVMGAFVGGGLVWALDRFRDDDPATAAPAVTESAAPAPVPSAPAAPPVVDAPTLISPAGVQALDPQGDGGENDQDAPRAVDGDPASSWQTQRYESQDFGGLKTGLGLAFDLGAPADIQSVVIDAPGDGGTYEVRAGTGPAFDGSTVIATGTTGEAPSTLAPTAPVTTQFVIVWFTGLAEVEGDWRGVVNEVQVQVP